MPRTSSRGDEGPGLTRRPRAVESVGPELAAPQGAARHIPSAPSIVCRGMRRITILVWLLVVARTALAHVPVFPEGEGPFDVDTPLVSKAYYLHLSVGARHAFTVPPLARAIPVQVLVLDDERGASLRHEARVDCGEGWRTLRAVDTPFFEPFSRTAHRYRVVDSIGPTATTCRIEVSQVEGPPGPYTFSIGDEERFSVGDLFGLLGLEARLRAWREGPR
jgi:hypothetical protein